MIYRSNLKAPDLAPRFAATTICKVRPWSMGHDVLSDAEFEPDCGFMTHDEAAILYNVAQSIGPEWLDIGARTGWTTAHVIAAQRHAHTWCVDPMLNKIGFQDRLESNLSALWGGVSNVHGCTSAAYFDAWEKERPRRGYFQGVCIDGNHDAPHPLEDAKGALAHLADTGVIIFHDFWGRPIREGVEYLMNEGLKCRVYNTPAGVAVCWRGDFAPPDHVPDPAIDWARVRRDRAPEFDFARCA